MTDQTRPTDDTPPADPTPGEITAEARGWHRSYDHARRHGTAAAPEDAPTVRPLPTHGAAHMWKTTATDLANQVADARRTIDSLRTDLTDADNVIQATRDAYATLGHALTLHDAIPTAAALGSPPARAQGLDVDDLLTNVRRSLAQATDDDERAEVIEMLLSGWYAAWPDEALTDPNAPLAAELVRLLTAKPARAQDQVQSAARELLQHLRATEPLRPADWERQAVNAVTDAWAYLADDTGTAQQLAETAVRAIIDARLVGWGGRCPRCGSPYPRITPPGAPAADLLCTTCTSDTDQPDPAEG